MKWQDLLNTDPLALIALGGFVAVIVVTLGVFGFLVTRRNPGNTGR
ncbi:MAG: hypothetical protein AB1749_06015 [Pseudomonadota bacterium]